MTSRKSTAADSKATGRSRAKALALGSGGVGAAKPPMTGRRVAGGAGTEAGMNFQAAVTAIAYVYMARGQRLYWLEKVADDVPVCVDAETGGAGDDIRLLLKSDETVEVQVKKGLRSGSDLWESLSKMASSIEAGTIDYGVLIVSPTSSKTITEELANDIARLGDGRDDNLSSIATQLVTKLNALGLPIADSCKRIRIHTVSALDFDQASVQASRAELAYLCAMQGQVSAAWNALYKDATSLIEHRGRRDVSAVLRLLRSEGITLAGSMGTVPILLLEKLATWTLATNSVFSIFGVRKKLRTDEAWIPLRAVVRDEAETKSESLADALKIYQAWEERTVPHDAVVVNPETLGRFVTRAIVVGGPGMGKSTLLKRITRRYSEDHIPVLHLRLSMVAKRMQAGSSFEEAVFDLGLDGSGITTAAAKQAAFPNWLLLCDGLDECGRLQEDVATGAASFAAGHPGCRMLVTTRPVGYDTAHFSDWRHYYLAPLEPFSAPGHLAMLVQESAPENSPVHDHAYALCAAELERGETGKIVARSPLFLGLAASIIVRGGHLGRTRERIFEQIFELIDEVPNSRIPQPPAPAPVLQRFLDILGWHIIAEPLNPIDKTLQRCAEELACETGSKLLSARGEAENYLRYWQDVGMIERIGHGCDETLAFIHKSFGEFAAARHLRSMPAMEQISVITGVVDIPEWAEVVRFAGLLGLANTMGDILLASGITGFNRVKRIVRAVELITEATPPPEPALRERIVTEAFVVVSSTRRSWAFKVAGPLVAAARRFPEEVGPSAGAFLSHEQPWTRFVAWATAVAAGPSHYCLEDLADVLRTSADIAGPGSEASLGGGTILLRGDKHDLAENFALAAAAELLDRSPSELTDAIVFEVFNHPDFGSRGFLQKARELLRSKGKNDGVGRREKIDWFSSPKGFAEAQLIAYEAMFDALDLPAPSVDDDTTPGLLLHFSAFLEASGFMRFGDSNIWAWTRPYDKGAAREALKGFIGASGIDLEMLRHDAQQARTYRHSTAATEDYWLFAITTHVDPPVIDWTLARNLDLNITKIEAALFHPSRWIVWLAANLLEALLAPPELEDLVRRLFAGGKAHTLWAASGLAGSLKQDRAIALLFERLSKPLVRGCHHLFGLLRRLGLPWGGELSGIVRAGLKGDVDTALEAAELVAHIAKPGHADLAAIIEAALAYWLEHEESYPTKGGVVPNSPRANLIEALIKIRLPTYLELRAYVADPRSDVRNIGADKFIEWLRLPEALRDQFLSDIRTETIPPHLLGKVLEARVPLNCDEIALVAGLLGSENAKIRYSAMSLLHKEYLDTAQIRANAQAMTGDNEQQIRDRAYRILDSL